METVVSHGKNHHFMKWHISKFSKFTFREKIKGRCNPYYGRPFPLRINQKTHGEINSPFLELTQDTDEIWNFARLKRSMRHDKSQALKILPDVSNWFQIAKNVYIKLIVQVLSNFSKSKFHSLKSKCSRILDANC